MFGSSLRRQTVGAIVLAITVMAAGLYVVTSRIFLRDFAAIERRSAEQDVQRAVEEVREQMAKLNFTATDWAEWDDTYTFIQDGNQAYRDANLTDPVVKRLALHGMAYVRPDGEVVSGRGMVRGGETVNDLIPSLRALLAPSVGVINPEMAAPRQGLVVLPEGPMMIASRAIIKSDGTGPARGTLVFARLLDETLVAELGESVDAPFVLTAWSAAPGDLRARLEAPGAPSSIIVPGGDDVIHGYALLRDVFGAPALLLHASMDRPIYRQGRSTLWYVLFATLAMGGLLAMLVSALLEHLVLARVVRLSGDLARIEHAPDPAARVAAEGYDELAQLAAGVNRVLEALSGAQQSAQSANVALQQQQETLEREKTQLESLNRTMLGREERVLEMKREVNALLKELGRPIRYQA